MRYTRYTDEELIQAVRENHGLITRAAKSLGVSSNVFYHRRAECPELADAIREARELMIDTAETSLMKLLEQNDFRAINLVLRTLGKDRGYVERVETVVLTDEAIEKAIREERAKAGEDGPRLAVVAGGAA